MKVAYFIGSLNRGGTEMLTLDICRKKDYAPYEMILIYRNEGELSEGFRETGVKMFRIKPKGLKIGYLFRLRKLLKAEQVDLVHAQTFVNSRIVLIATSFSSIRCVSSFHGFSFAQAPLLARRFVMKRSDELVFVSRYVRDYYLQRNKFCNEKKCNVVYNGIDSEKFEQKYPAPDFLEANDSVMPKRIKLTMVGNFVDVRSQIVICRSIKLLKEQGVEVQKQAIESNIDVATMKTAFRDTLEALESISNYKQEALPKLRETIDEFRAMTDEGEKILQRMEKHGDLQALPDEEQAVLTEDAVDTVE